MINKWRNRIIVFTLITVFLAVIAFYLYKSTMDTNNKMARLGNADNLIEAEMVKLDSVNYVGEAAYTWGYNLPSSVNFDRKGKVDGITITRYTLSDFENMNGKVKVYYIIEEDGSLFTYDQNYVDNFKPWVPSQSIVLWILASFSFMVALLYLGRNIFLLYILKKGEESVGNFEEAFRPRSSSSRYYKVKYTFEKDGQVVSAVTPAIYDGREVDKLHAYGQFIVRYIGKHSAIDQKL